MRIAAADLLYCDMKVQEVREDSGVLKGFGSALGASGATSEGRMQEHRSRNRDRNHRLRLAR